MKQIGSLFAFTTADVVGDSRQEVVGMTGDVNAVLQIGSVVETPQPSPFGGRKHKGRHFYNPSPKGTAAGRLTRRRGGQRHDRTHGD
jgi:hypothetical protein